MDFGLQNIAATVEKYSGEYYTESIVENGKAVFRISIAIPKDGVQKNTIPKDKRRTGYENMYCGR